MTEKYVDSFVLPVRKSELAAYEKFAAKMADIAKKHGASQYANFIADDIRPGKKTSFPLAVKLQDDEVVVQSLAVYPTKEARDKANDAILKDEDFKKLAQHIPTDGKRMFSGGFKVLRGL